MNNQKQPPSMDAWLAEAKAHESAPKIGMYLTHISPTHVVAFRSKIQIGVFGLIQLWQFLHLVVYVQENVVSFIINE